MISLDHCLVLDAVAENPACLECVLWFGIERKTGPFVHQYGACRAKFASSFDVLFCIARSIGFTAKVIMNAGIGFQERLQNIKSRGVHDD